MAQNEVDRQLEEILQSLPQPEKGAGAFLFGESSYDLSSNKDQGIGGFSRTFAHLEINGSSSQEIRFLMLEKTPRLPREIKVGYESASFSASMDFHSQTVIISDWNNRVTYFLSTNNPFDFGRPDLARASAQALFDSDYFAIHGGLIAWEEDSGVLITAKGGSGKSSTVTACVRNGSMTAGDDFLMARFTNETTVRGYSLFSSVRLATESPEHSLMKKNPVTSHDGKDTFDLKDLSAKAVVGSIGIKSLVVPKVSNTTSLREISKRSALLAIAPSSIGLSTNKQRSMGLIAKMVEQTPCYELLLGPDGDENARQLKLLGEK